MYLSRVDIEQFRSIESITFAFDNRCSVLLGINETGKSNVLRALALLSERRDVVADDLRQPGAGEDAPQNGTVRFVFKMERKDLDALEARLVEDVAGAVGRLRIKLGDADVALREFIEHVVGEVLYTVSVPSGHRTRQYWRLEETVELSDDWLVREAGCHPRASVRHPDRGSIPAAECALIHRDCVESTPVEGSYAVASAGHLLETVTQRALEMLELPPCIFWSYAEDSVLPSEIAWPAFVQNPSMVPVVQHMFAVGGVRDVRQAVEDAQKTDTGLEVLLERVSRRVTGFLRDTWKEFGSLSFELRENGKYLKLRIRDVASVYTFSQRSDGFRRFVGFLLAIASQEAAGTLRGALLLYDEPDTSLHPSGAKQLRDELIRLSETNLVVYSTHSIFMVDGQDVRRHYIVRRERERTRVARAGYGNIKDEEVLYRAIGTSVFEVLREHNVLLEGWRDKKLFETALMRADEGLVAFFDTVGLCHSGGVRSVPHIAPMIELVERPYLVLTDSDRAARDARDGTDAAWPWKLYADYVGPRFSTAEDLVDAGKLASALEIAGKDFAELAGLRFSESDGAFLRQIEGKLHSVDRSTRKAILNALKEHVFEGLQPRDVRDEALTILRGVRDDLRKQAKG